MELGRNVRNADNTTTNPQLPRNTVVAERDCFSLAKVAWVVNLNTSMRAICFAKSQQPRADEEEPKRRAQRVRNYERIETR